MPNPSLVHAGRGHVFVFIVILWLRQDRFSALCCSDRRKAYLFLEPVHDVRRRYGLPVLPLVDGLPFPSLTRVPVRLQERFDGFSCSGNWWRVACPESYHSLIQRLEAGRFRIGFDH